MNENKDEGGWEPLNSDIMVAAGAWCPKCCTNYCMFHFPGKHSCQECDCLLTDKQYYDLLLKNPAPKA